MDAPLEAIVAMALEQAVEMAALDGPRAEAWASDLIALADESAGPSGPVAMVERLARTDGPAAAVALLAISAVAPDLVSPAMIAELDEAPRWADSAGTSQCVDVVEIHRDDLSLAFRFADAAGAEHLLLVDLERGPPEQLGEVRVAPIDLLDAALDAGDRLRLVPTDVRSPASRTALAAWVTNRPCESAVINGRLLVARLAPLTHIRLSPPRPSPDVIVDLPELDPADSAYALELFDRAIEGIDTDLESAPATPAFEAAARLRDAGDDGSPASVWMEAAAIPRDSPASPRDLLIAATAATIRPARLDPLTQLQRDAVMSLELADWLGAMLELLREGPGAVVRADLMVDRVNRCPEVTTTIPRPDRARIEWAFRVLTDHWDVMGVIDGDRILTDLGRATLAPALRLAWS